MSDGAVRQLLGPPVSGAENVLEDDRLLAEGRLTVRAAVLADTSVSFGVGERAPTAVTRSAEAAKLPIVRRSTGGSGLLHLPGDIVWSVVLPRHHALVGRDFTRAYPRLGAGVVDALRARSVPAEWTPPMGVSTSYCFLGPRGEALTVGGRALGGAAQHVTRGTLLHQGVIAHHVDAPALERIFDLPSATSVRYLTGLAEWGLSGVSEAIAREVVESLARRVTGDPVRSVAR
ncbi:MAG: lipoate--protein ligase family protein [Thermoplasmata archaeon]